VKACAARGNQLCSSSTRRCVANSAAHFKRAWSAWRLDAAGSSWAEDVCMRRSPSGPSTSGVSACTSPSACAVPPGRARHRDVLRCVCTRTVPAERAATASPDRRLNAGAACTAAQTDANENPKSPPNALLVASAELCEARRPPTAARPAASRAGRPPAGKPGPSGCVLRLSGHPGLWPGPGTRRARRCLRAAAAAGLLLARAPSAAWALHASGSACRVCAGTQAQPECMQLKRHAVRNLRRRPRLGPLLRAPGRSAAGRAALRLEHKRNSAGRAAQDGLPAGGAEAGPRAAGAARRRRRARPRAQQGRRRRAEPRAAGRLLTVLAAMQRGLTAQGAPAGDERLARLDAMRAATLQLLDDVQAESVGSASP